MLAGSTSGLAAMAVSTRFKLPRQLRHHFGFEAVMGVFYSASQATVLFSECQREIEFGYFRLDRHGLQRKSRQGRRRQRGILQNQHHLKDGCLLQRPFGMKRLDKVFKREVLVRIGCQVAALHAPEQVRKRFTSFELGAQGERIHEATDDRFQLAAVAVGHHCTDDDIVLAAPARKQQREGGMQHHEQAGAVLVGEF